MTARSKDGPALTNEDYIRLAAFRHALRRFMTFSAAAAQAAGLTPHQHQAMLAIKGAAVADGSPGMTVGGLAEHLTIAPHTAGELVGRLETAGLVRRQADADDKRRVRLVLTNTAEQALESLSRVHLHEVRGLAPRLMTLLADFERGVHTDGPI